MAGGLARVAGNKTPVSELVGAVRSRSSADADLQIEEALAKADRPLAERLAHTSEGRCRDIGILGVQEAAGKVEKSIREIDPSTAIDISELKSALAPQIALIRAALPPPGISTEPAQAFDRERAVSAVVRLLSLIEANDGDATDVVQEVAAALAGKVDVASWMRSVSRSRNSISMPRELS